MEIGDNMNTEAFISKHRIYKMEVFNNIDQQNIVDHIKSNNGKCAILGSAIITDYIFNTDKFVSCVGRITNDPDCISEYDINCFLNA